MFNKSCFNKTLYNREVSFYIAFIYSTEIKAGILNDCIYSIENKIGIKKIHIIPTNNYILLNDISFVRSHYGKAIKLGNKILELNTNITEDYTVRILKYEWNNKYVDIVIRSDGKVFVNGRENQYYDISWFIANDGSFIIHPEANAIDEICIIPEIIDDSEIKKWYDREVYFYDREQNIVNIPKEVDIEII